MVVAGASWSPGCAVFFHGLSISGSHQPARRRRRRHRCRRSSRLRPEGHQEGAGLLDGQPVSSWSPRSASGVEAMFHLFTTLLQGLPVPGAGSPSHACHHSFNMVDDMGGRRSCPRRSDLPDRHGRLRGHLPAVGVLVRTDPGGTGLFPGSSHANGTYHLMLTVADRGVLHCGLHDLHHLVRRSTASTAATTPPRVGPHHRPLIILATLGAIAGLVTCQRSFGWLDVPTRCRR